MEAYPTYSPVPMSRAQILYRHGTIKIKLNYVQTEAWRYDTQTVPPRPGN